MLQILFPVNSRQGYRNSSPVLARRNFSQWSALVCYIDRLVDIFLLSRYGIVTGKLIFCPEPFHNSFNLVILSKQHGLCASVHIHWFFTSKKLFNLPSRELRNKKFLYLVQMINTFNCRCNEKFVPRQCFFSMLIYICILFLTIKRCKPAKVLTFYYRLYTGSPYILLDSQLRSHHPKQREGLM